MNSYILQRYELRGNSLLIVDGTKFQMEPCSAVAYLAFKPEANKDELVQRMKDALEEAYGKQMDIIVTETKSSAKDESSIPSALYLEDVKSLHHIPFLLEYIPVLKDMNSYSNFNGRLIPVLRLELFVPNGHAKYFEARSVQLHYVRIHNFEEWIKLENEVAALQEQCIPEEEWLPKKE